MFAHARAGEIKARAASRLVKWCATCNFGLRSPSKMSVASYERSHSPLSYLRFVSCIRECAEETRIASSREDWRPPFCASF